MPTKYPQEMNASGAGGAKSGVMAMAHVQVFSARSLAQRWGCSPKTIAALVKREELHPFRVGRLLRFSICEVQRFENAIAEPAAGARFLHDEAAG